MAITHLTCPECSGAFDYETTWDRMVYAGLGAIITSDQRKRPEIPVKLSEKRQLTCPYCQKWWWYTVNLRNPSMMPQMTASMGA
jgi:uncharacterized protein YbaR (Trm112 family)